MRIEKSVLTNRPIFGNKLENTLKADPLKGISKEKSAENLVKLQQISTLQPEEANQTQENNQIAANQRIQDEILARQVLESITASLRNSETSGLNSHPGITPQGVTNLLKED